jgi:FkbM family methyltransferase
MRNLHRGVRSVAALILNAAHPRSIAWQIKHAHKPVHPVITRLGRSGDLRVRIYSRDVLGKAVYQHRVSEPKEVQLVTRFLQRGMVFFDVGANFGQYTLLAAERVGPAGQVHSFEPSRRMFEELSFNVNLNTMQDRCTLNRGALSDTQGRAKLSQYEAGAEVYGSLGTQHWAKARIVGYEEVTATTLDAYIAQHLIPHVDLIKMDIEGAELLALRGGEALLRRADAPAIVLEMADVNTTGFGYGALDTWDYLESFGYRLLEFNNRRAALSEARRPSDFQAAQNLLAVKCRP